MILDNIPAIIAGFTFYPAGLIFGQLFYLPLTDITIYNKTEYWPFIIIAFAAVITAGLLNGTKLNYRKHHFHHLYYLTFGLICFLAAGIVFFTVDYDSIISALYLGAVGNGMVYIAALNYINIRSKKNARSTLLSIAHFYYLAGIATVATLRYADINITLAKFHEKVGLALMISSVCVMLFIVIVEIWQNSITTFDYKKCLDYNLNLANDTKNLLFRSDNNGANAAQQQQSPYWFNRPNLFNDSNLKKSSNYQGLWTFYLLMTKFQGLILFYYVFFYYSSVFGLGLVFNSTKEHHLLMWFAAAGGFLGVLLLYFLRSKIVFGAAATFQIVSLVVAVVLFYDDDFKGMTISLFVFYFAASVGYSIPDMNILEIATFKFKEGLLAIGHIIEIVPIGVFQYVSINHPNTFMGIEQVNSFNYLFDKDKYLGHIIGVSVASLVLIVLVTLHMLNTFKRSLIDISYELIYNKSYTVFNLTRDDVERRSKSTRAQRNIISSLGNSNYTYEEEEEGNKRGPAYSGRESRTMFASQKDLTVNEHAPVHNAFNYATASRTGMLPRVSMQPKVNPNFDRY